MKYMILSYESEADLESRDGNDASHSVPYQVAWWAYVGALSRAGIVEAIHDLRPNFTVTTVRFRDGKSFLQDGRSKFRRRPGDHLSHAMATNDACHQHKTESRFSGGSYEQFSSVIHKHERRHPQVVSHKEWLAARKDLLAAEKEFNRRRDALSEQRRKLPMVRVDKEYVFEGPSGRVTLRELFGKHRQLIVYHFMFDPEWTDGCKSCSHFMDNAAGSVVHLAARATAFVVICRARLAKIEPFKRRMGWAFPWLSSFGTDFNYDFHVTLDQDAGSVEYNYANAADLVKSRKLWSAKGELPGLSVFMQDGDIVYHTYSTYQRGLDLPLNTYNFLDLTPLGRQEDGGPAQAWIRHHDRYV